MAENRDYKSEVERLRSFQRFSHPVCAQQLADAGFFHTGSEDIVRCAFCDVEVMDWEVGDDAFVEHRKWSPNCAFLQNRNSVGNISMEEAARDECGIYKLPPMSPGAMKLLLKSIPRYPYYETLERRRNTFKTWPVNGYPVEQLVEAGFFYTGNGDQTTCFHCGLGLSKWRKEDNCWEDHARFSKCNFVTDMKGQDFMRGTRPPTMTSEEIKLAMASSKTSDTAATSKDEPSYDGSYNAFMCKICVVKTIAMAFIPCGHVIACVNCAVQLSECAVCRKAVVGSVKIRMD